MKVYKKICRYCKKEFECEGRIQYCSEFCRSEANRIRCLNHYYKVIKPGLVTKGQIQERKKNDVVKIKITEDIQVFPHLRPKIGAVYEAEKPERRSGEKQIYIIRSIDNGLIVRDDECIEVGGE